MKGSSPGGKQSYADRAKRRDEAIEKAKKLKEGREAKERAEIKELNQRIKIEMPAPGKQWIPPHVAAIEETMGKPDEEEGPKLTSRLFSHLPLSQKTVSGLKSANFLKLSEIQRGTIPHALAGRDVLGEAQTGSGKTLAFIIPAMEVLFRESFDSSDGLGVLIVTPTRELASQIFDVIRAVGRFHDFSAGVVIGGKDVEDERERLSSLNIIVATPGRLQQHIDESPSWDAVNCKLLILDEADRMLDAGFRPTMEVIFRALPKDRQTLLFSATLHSAVNKLAELNLRKPIERVSVDAQSSTATPAKLQQVSFFVPNENKIDTLFSFLRAHSRKRMLVFVSACKQVRFLYESFKQLKPGCLVLELHGKQKQQRRIETIDQFSKRTEAVVMICTDVASRGLDFPTVDWVIQYDAPESVDTYLHRVGRTARFGKSGSALLFLTPSEEPFLRRLAAKNIPISKAAPNAAKQLSLKRKLSSLLAEQPELKHLAQKAFISYVRSLALMPDKEVFNVHASVNGQALAESLGLPAPPAITLPGQENVLVNSAVLHSLSGGKRQVFDSDDDEERPAPVEVTFDNNPLKAKKNMSKLEKLKEKIKAKKEAKKEAFEAALAAGGSFDDAAAAADAIDEAERNKRMKGDEKMAGGSGVVIDSDNESLMSSDAEQSKTKVSKKERKLQRAKDMKERLKEEARKDTEEIERIKRAGGDVFEETTGGLLKPIAEHKAAHTQQQAIERQKEFLDHARAIAKEGRLRFRSDGTAKIRGLGGAAIVGAHNFFDDNIEEASEVSDDEKKNKTITRFEKLSREGGLGMTGGDSDSDSDDESDVEIDGKIDNKARNKFIEKMRSRMLDREEIDKKADKERVKAVHKRRKEKLKMNSRRDVDQQELAMLGGSDDDEDRSVGSSNSDDDNSGSDNDTRRGGKKRDYSSDSSSSSSSESSSEDEKPAKRAKVVPSKPAAKGPARAATLAEDVSNLESAALALLGGF